MVSRAGGRLHLDGSLLPPMVWSAGQAAGQVPHLQRLAPPPLGSVKMTSVRSIDGLIAELQALGEISEAEPPVVTRVVFGEADLRARAYVKRLCVDAGLEVTEDAIGNTFARWEGSQA